MHISVHTTKASVIILVDIASIYNLFLKLGLKLSITTCKSVDDHEFIIMIFLMIIRVPTPSGQSLTSAETAAATSTEISDVSCAAASVS